MAGTQRFKIMQQTESTQLSQHDTWLIALNARSLSQRSCIAAKIREGLGVKSSSQGLLLGRFSPLSRVR